MGVTGLWSVLLPVKKHVALSSLAGKTLAVDLSIWVCETQCVKQMQGVVTKPYLRNLFFRILYLKQIGIHLIFIVDGEAPELKWDVMQKRLHARHHGKFETRAARKQGRKNFRLYLKECCQLLEFLGIPYIQSHGEAEAMCAHLDAVGLVNGCLTDDGDAFLYGARTVYRNFTLNSKDPHVDCYTMDDIETQLGINQYGLIALALLLGCDYLPNGVPGVGVASARKLLQTLQGVNILNRFLKWQQNSVDFVCFDGNEELIRKKALRVEGFPQKEVIDEFLDIKENCPLEIPSWRRPELVPLLEFASCKLEWPPEYTLEKILPLITLWDMLDMNTKGSEKYQQQRLQPEGIVKTRIRQGVPCFEVKWKILDVIHIAKEAQKLVTIETQELFQKCYPESVKQFQLHQQEQKAVSKLKGKKKKAHCSLDSNEMANNKTEDDEKMDVRLMFTSSQSVTESETSHHFDDPSLRKKNSGKLRSRSTFRSGVEPVSVRKDVNKMSPMGNDTNTNGKGIISDVMNLSDLIKRLDLNVKTSGQCQQSITDQSDYKDQSDNEDEYMGLPLSQRLIKRSQNALFKAERMQDNKPITRTDKMADVRMGVTFDFPRVVPENCSEINEGLFSERNQSKICAKGCRDFESNKSNSFENFHNALPDLNRCIKQCNCHRPEKSDKNICPKLGMQVGNQMESTLLHKLDLSLVSPCRACLYEMSIGSVLSNTDCVDECSHKEEQVNDKLSLTSVISIQNANGGSCALVPEEENICSNLITNCKSSPNCSADLFTSMDQSHTDCILPNDEINQEHSLSHTDCILPNDEINQEHSQSHTDCILPNDEINQEHSLIVQYEGEVRTNMERSVIDLYNSIENLDNKENIQNKVKRDICKSEWTQHSTFCKDDSNMNYEERKNSPKRVKLKVLSRDFRNLESSCSEKNGKVIFRHVSSDKLASQKTQNEKSLIRCDSSIQFGNFNIETSILNSLCESFKESDNSEILGFDSDFHYNKFQNQPKDSFMTAEYVKKQLDSPDEYYFSCKNFDIGAVDNIEKKLLCSVDSNVQSFVDEVDESKDTRDMGLAERLRRRMKDPKSSQVLDLLSSQI